MGITVEELVALPELGTSVLAGSGGLNRQIGWAHVCELPSPWDWLGAGDLLMTTGLGIPAGGAEPVPGRGQLADVRPADLSVQPAGAREHGRAQLR